MIKVQVDKVWLGKVSVRDYIYKKALRKKESLGIVHGKEYMFIPYGKTWKKGKEAKEETIQKMLTTKECISGKQFLQLLSDLDDAWHQHEGKDIEIEVTFKGVNNE